jgi:hypothetical protein
MPEIRFEPTISVFQWAKTVHALDCATIVIGNNSVPISQKTYSFSSTKMKRLMQVREIMALYS